MTLITSNVQKSLSNKWESVAQVELILELDRFIGSTHNRADYRTTQLCIQSRSNFKTRLLAKLKTALRVCDDGFIWTTSCAGPFTFCIMYMPCIALHGLVLSGRLNDRIIGLALCV